jgi:hypothetical protein
MIKPNPKNQPKRNGRPYKVIDYKMLDNLCALQCTGAEIAGAMGMDYDTLNNGLKRETGKGFTDYFSEKRSVGLISLRRQQYKVAMQGNPSLLKWLGQNWLGQSDTPQQVQADVKLSGFRIVDDDIDLSE